MHEWDHVIIWEQVDAWMKIFVQLLDFVKHKKGFTGICMNARIDLKTKTWKCTRHHVTCDIKNLIFQQVDTKIIILV